MPDTSWRPCNQTLEGGWMSHVFTWILGFNASDSWTVSPPYSNIKKIFVKETSTHLLSEVPDDLASVIHYLNICPTHGTAIPRRAGSREPAPCALGIARPGFRYLFCHGHTQAMQQVQSLPFSWENLFSWLWAARKGRTPGVNNHWIVAGHCPGLPEEAPTPTGSHGNKWEPYSKGMGSVTKGLTENISFFLMESLKGLPDTLGDIDAHPVSYHWRGTKTSWHWAVWS